MRCEAKGGIGGVGACAVMNEVLRKPTDVARPGGGAGGAGGGYGSLSTGWGCRQRMW